MTIPKGWGIGPWGIEPWGSVIPLPALALQSAVAISTKEVRIVLSREPQKIADTVYGDVLNPKTWTIQRLDTGYYFSVLSVREESLLIYVIQVLQDFGPDTAQHRVSTTSLKDLDGNTIGAAPFNQADFAGLLAAAAKDDPTRAMFNSNATRDVACPPLPAGNVSSTIGGVLKIGAAGDYELESGVSLLKKLILRRLVTERGEIFYLPDYGIGFRIKEPMPVADLIKLRGDIIRQVEREPEVESANVSLTMGMSNDLTIQIRARIRSSGESFEMSIKSGALGVAL